jgi:arginine decarboxylase
MKNTYFQLINQTYYFPQDGFDINNDYLTFHNYSLKYLIEKYGTPLRMTFLPRIGDQIKKAKNHFNRAIKANNYKGEYFYCYCTKCCHFNHVISEALNHGVHLETSSSFDIDLIRKLYEKGKINKKTYLIHNGHKNR